MVCPAWCDLMFKLTLRFRLESQKMSSTRRWHYFSQSSFPGRDYIKELSCTGLIALRIVCTWGSLQPWFVRDDQDEGEKCQWQVYVQREGKMIYVSINFFNWNSPHIFLFSDWWPNSCIRYKRDIPPLFFGLKKGYFFIHCGLNFFRSESGGLKVSLKALQQFFLYF